MSVLRWEGTATALSSVAHGGEALGTVTYLRREKFLLPDRTVEDLPVVSGNAVRGVLRDVAADLLWEQLGCPRLPLPVVHALWSGGALVKAKGEPLSGERLARLRRLVPHVGVFGTAGGGRIIDGALQVGKLVPLCAELAHLLPQTLAAGDLPSYWDLLQIEYYSRFPDGDQLTDVVAAKNAPTSGDEERPVGADTMRYGMETFAAGTQFHTWFALVRPTGAEAGFFRDALAMFAKDAAVGGRLARGHGRLRLDLAEPTDEARFADWRDRGDATLDDVLEVLRWLD